MKLLAIALLGCSVAAIGQMGSNIESPASDFEIQDSSHNPGSPWCDAHSDAPECCPPPGGCTDSPENATIVLAGLAALMGVGFNLKRRATPSPRQTDWR